MPDAFERYVGDHTKYFVPREKVTPSQAVQLIRKAKGFPVLNLFRGWAYFFFCS